MKTTSALTLAAFTFFCGFSPASAQPFSIDSHVLGGGGGASAGGRFSLNGTPGQAEAGAQPMSGGNFSLTGGFWSRVATNLVPDEELIVNGSFEDTAGTFIGDSFGLMSLPAGSVAIPGWTTTTAELGWVDNTNSFGAGTPFGRYSLELTGYHDGRPYAGLVQTIATVPGRKYRLSLALGSNADYPGAGGQKSVSVCVGSYGTVFILEPTNTTGNQWATFSFGFTADSPATEISISGLVASGVYLGLDNVSVVPDYSVPPPAGQELVVNGSFENACAFAPDGSGVMSLLAGSADIPGWTTMTAELGWALNGNAFGPRSPYGALFVDLTGYHDAPPYAGITQTLATSPGQAYRLSFAIGAYEDAVSYRGPMEVSVMAGSASNSFVFVPAGPGNQWGTFTMDFTAGSASTPLRFVGAATAGGAYLGLDNISVVAHEASLSIGAVDISGTDFHFKFSTVPGRTYSIESRDNLESGAWEMVPGSERPGTGSELQITIADLFSKSRQFYRVKVTQ